MWQKEQQGVLQICRKWMISTWRKKKHSSDREREKKSMTSVHMTVNQQQHRGSCVSKNFRNFSVLLFIIFSLFRPHGSDKHSHAHTNASVDFPLFNNVSSLGQKSWFVGFHKYGGILKPPPTIWMVNIHCNVAIGSNSNLKPAPSQHKRNESQSPVATWKGANSIKWILIPQHQPEERDERDLLTCPFHCVQLKTRPSHS